MQLLPLEKLGANERAGNQIEFGIFLPWISAKEGYRLFVKIIHEKDQFLQDIAPLRFELAHSVDPNYGDYWSTFVIIQPDQKLNPSSAWGEKGRYIYRYCLICPNAPYEIDWIIDPFAREFGIGKLSAFSLGYEHYSWSDEERNWQTPPLEDCIVYEIMFMEFTSHLKESLHKLDYLQDLGVNCLEIMPVTNVSDKIDWGYMPIGYFGVDERLGKRKELQRFVDEAHKRGIAVVLDMVYGHTSDQFTYSYLYRKLQFAKNPFMGRFTEDSYGESTDFSLPFTQDFFFTVNYHWLDCYHIDGIRYDCVSQYWDGPTGCGYAKLAFQTYEIAKQKTQGPTNYWHRFKQANGLNLIQCAEELKKPIEILKTTYTNCVWQNTTLDAARQVAKGNKTVLANMGLQLGLWNYPATEKHNEEILTKNAMQYLENHDHSRFICNFGITTREDQILLQEGNREKWYKLQPYFIALLTCRGVPLLWQGQEIVENYFVPEAGWGRVMLYRPVRWEYFYDAIGQGIVKLIRKLIRLRKEEPQFRKGSYYFYNEYELYQSKFLLLFSREDDKSFSLVALNFGDTNQSVSFTFPRMGTFTECLEKRPSLEFSISTKGESRTLEIPSNYGRIWTMRKEKEL